MWPGVGIATDFTAPAPPLWDRRKALFPDVYRLAPRTPTGTMPTRWNECGFRRPLRCSPHRPRTWGATSAWQCQSSRRHSGRIGAGIPGCLHRDVEPGVDSCRGSEEQHRRPSEIRIAIRPLSRACHRPNAAGWTLTPVRAIAFCGTMRHRCCPVKRRAGGFRLLAN